MFSEELNRVDVLDLKHNNSCVDNKMEKYLSQ